MKKKITVSIIVILLVAFISIVASNIYIGILTNTSNNLLKFSTDNSEIQFKFEIHPISAFDQINNLNQRVNSLKDEGVVVYNNNVDSILILNNDLVSIINQANKLGIDINDKFILDSTIFKKVTSFDENLFTITNNRLTYLRTYKKYLSNIFAELIDLKKKQGKFANPLWGKSDKDLINLLSEMTVDEKAGQMLIFSLEGYSLSQKNILRYTALNSGGLIIMGGNVSDSTQLKLLTKQIQELNSEIPMFIATDQEGGAVKRIGWDNTVGQKSWANMSEKELCDIGKDRSNLLLNLGINMNFSPVVDLSYPGTAFINNRTISNDSKIVTDKTKTYISCGQEQGIIDTLKHFPGHGPTTLDSHLHLPLVQKNKQEWLSSDAIPFKENLETKQIMMGHLLYSGIDKDNPSTLSKIFITDILRKEWGYKGLIITDDMNMLHTSTRISVRDGLVRSINAGIDIVLYVGAPTSFEDIKTQLVDIISKGDISEERINDSIFRILSAKRDLSY
jgi:beta-N-acetylhexosaminidase